VCQLTLVLLSLLFPLSVDVVLSGFKSRLTDDGSMRFISVRVKSELPSMSDVTPSLPTTERWHSSLEVETRISLPAFIFESASAVEGG